MDKKGQNVLEYVLLVAMVIVIIIAFIAPGGSFRQALEDVLDDGVDMIETGTDAINFDDL